MCMYPDSRVQSAGSSLSPESPVSGLAPSPAVRVYRTYNLGSLSFPSLCETQVVFLMLNTRARTAGHLHSHQRV